MLTQSQSLVLNSLVVFNELLYYHHLIGSTHVHGFFTIIGCSSLALTKLLYWPFMRVMD